MRLLAVLAMTWIAGCWTALVYCVVIEQYGLAFGLAFASLALPLIVEAFDREQSA